MVVLFGTQRDLVAFSLLPVAYTKMDCSFQEQFLETYSNSDLVRYILECPTLSASIRRIFLLSPNLVAKQLIAAKAPDEIAAMKLSKKLHIRVPDIKRVVEDDRNVYVVMDRIQGTTLQEAWAQIGWLGTFQLGFQLRRFVHVMRTITSPTAGSLVSGKCDSIWLDDYYKLPLHATPEALTSFICFWLQYVSKRSLGQKGRRSRSDKQFVPSTPASLVFTHQDLAPRNLFVDNQGDLWLVDWGSSGWYPKYFEYVSMQSFDASNWGLAARLRWFLFNWVSVGVFRREQRALELVRSKFIRYPIGRKDIVLPAGAHLNAIHLRKPDV